MQEYILQEWLAYAFSFLTFPGMRPWANYSNTLLQLSHMQNGDYSIYICVEVSIKWVYKVKCLEQYGVY